jgi:hypothetical protein
MKPKERSIRSLDEMKCTGAQSMRCGNRSQKNEAGDWMERCPCGRTDASLKRVGKGRGGDRQPDSPHGCYLD